MYYPSNGRDYSSLSIGVSDFENTYGGRKWYLNKFLTCMFDRSYLNQFCT